MWLNSRSTRSGVVDLVHAREGGLKTKRQELPDFVSEALRALYAATAPQKGAPDLVIWNVETATLRFVEVKCPNWDRPSPEQLKFLATARDNGIDTSIAEWEFAD